MTHKSKQKSLHQGKPAQKSKPPAHLLKGRDHVERTVPDRRAQLQNLLAVATQTNGLPRLMHGRTVDNYWKAHAFVEVVVSGKIAAKRYYIDFLDAYEDVIHAEKYPQGTLEMDTLTFFLLGATSMDQFVDTTGLKPLFEARGIPKDPPLSHSVERIYEKLSASTQRRCRHATYLNIGEVIAVQNTIRELTGRTSRTIGLLLGAMRAVQDYEGQPRLVFFLEKLETFEKRKPLETASQYR